MTIWDLCDSSETWPSSSSLIIGKFICDLVLMSNVVSFAAARNSINTDRVGSLNDSQSSLYWKSEIIWDTTNPLVLCWIFIDILIIWYHMIRKGPTWKSAKWDLNSSVFLVSSRFVCSPSTAGPLYRSRHISVGWVYAVVFWEKPAPSLQCLQNHFGLAIFFCQLEQREMGGEPHVAPDLSDSEPRGWLRCCAASAINSTERDSVGFAGLGVPGTSWGRFSCICMRIVFVVADFMCTMYCIIWFNYSKHVCILHCRLILAQIEDPLCAQMCLYTQKHILIILCVPKNQCFASTVNEIFDIYKDL